MTFRQEDQLRTIILTVSIAMGLCILAMLIAVAIWMT